MCQPDGYQVDSWSLAGVAWGVPKRAVNRQQERLPTVPPRDTSPPRP